MTRPAIHMTKAQTAEWMGYGDDIAAMDAEHDLWHDRLCIWLRMVSQSLRMARGESLTPRERLLADVEEDAVLHLQRLVQHERVREQFERECG